MRLLKLCEAMDGVAKRTGKYSQRVSEGAWLERDATELESLAGKK